MVGDTLDGSSQRTMGRNEGTVAALGFRAHSGWAMLVVLAGPVADPRVLKRQRVELAEPGIPGSKQPFHAAEGLDLPEAEKLVGLCTRTSRALALRAVRGAVADLRKGGHDVAGCGLLLAAGRPLPKLAAILASHALIHAAEGELFRDVLRHAGGKCGLSVTGVVERELRGRCAQALGLSEAALAGRLDGWRAVLGPPWGKDEKEAALVAWLALAEREA